MKIVKRLHKFLFPVLLMIFCFSNIQCDSIKSKEFKENGVLTTATVAEVIKETRKKTKGSQLSTYYLKVSFFAKEKKSDEDKEEAKEETKKDYGFDFLNKVAENFEIGNFTFAEISVSKEKAEDWIIIIDESIQIGQEKLLLMLGVRESKIDFTRALNYKDIVVVLQVSKSGWNSTEISKEIRKAEKILGKIKYAVSDNGPSIVKALKSCHIPQIHDITHRVGNILKKKYKNEDDFIELTKQANVLRSRIQQTNRAFLLPPNQRSKSRFLNLKPVILWSVKMLKIFEK